MAGLTQAKLIEIEFGEGDQVTEKPKGRTLDVQFNPETLRLTYANQLVQPQGGDQSAGTAGRQYVGSGTTKLALTLWFDVTAMETGRMDDVRRLTNDVVHFITPVKAEGEDKLTPPGLRFSWGSFLFDGIVEGLEETLDYFSPEGKPLRAQMSLTVSRQKILEAKFQGDGAVTGMPGQRPLSPARAGQSLQGMAAASTAAAPWQEIAAANGIEDPLRLPPGMLLDLRARTRGGTSSGLREGFGTGAGMVAQPGAGLQAGARVGPNSVEEEGRMAVVIQEFESVVEPERPAAGAADQADRGQNGAERTEPGAIERMLRHRAAMRLRRWAH